MMAADLAIPHFLEECHRPTIVSTCGSISKSTPGTVSQPLVNSDANSSSNLQCKGSSASTTGGPFSARPPGTCSNGSLDKVYMRN